MGAPRLVQIAHISHYDSFLETFVRHACSNGELLLHVADMNEWGSETLAALQIEGLALHLAYETGEHDWSATRSITSAVHDLLADWVLLLEPGDLLYSRRVFESAGEAPASARIAVFDAAHPGRRLAARPLLHAGDVRTNGADGALQSALAARVLPHAFIRLSRNAQTQATRHPERGGRREKGSARVTAHGAPHLGHRVLRTIDTHDTETISFWPLNYPPESWRLQFNIEARWPGMVEVCSIALIGERSESTIHVTPGSFERDVCVYNGIPLGHGAQGYRVACAGGVLSLQIHENTMRRIPTVRSAIIRMQLIDEQGHDGAAFTLARYGRRERLLAEAASALGAHASW
jgi:hypothetical protein